MARKIEYISMLAEDTAKEIVKNQEAWRHYLNASARLYKYPFQEQMLIYAQRPDAIACASIEIWNGTYTIANAAIPFCHQQNLH